MLRIGQILILAGTKSLEFSGEKIHLRAETYLLNLLTIFDKRPKVSFIRL